MIDRLTLGVDWKSNYEVINDNVVGEHEKCIQEVVTSLTGTEMGLATCLATLK